MGFKEIVKLIYRKILFVIYSKIKNNLSNLFIVHIPLTLQRATVIRALKPAFISTMSRSGTWYNREFYYFYNELLKGGTSSEILQSMIFSKLKISSLMKTDYNKIGYDPFFISHWLCPGFSDYNGKFRNDWDNLNFYSDYTYPSNFDQIPGYFNSEQIKVRYDISNNWVPVNNADSKLVYFYRNPLDQSVAYFSAIQNMKLQKLRYRKDSQGNLVLIKDIHEFLRTVGMDMYIKHFLTFQLMKKKYPNNLLLITYENLVRDPKIIFRKVLNFLGHDVTLSGNYEKFEKALNMSSKENIIKLENAYGRSIPGHYKDEFNDERQLRDGRIGKWKKYLDKNDLNYIAQRLQEYDISIDDFTIE